MANRVSTSRIGNKGIVSFKSYEANDNMPLYIHLIGCGGIGGWLVPIIARELSVRRNFTLTLYDGDIVESKNLIRQNFIASDIERNKAEVLAKRYSQLGVPIAYNPSYITFDKTPPIPHGYNLYVMGVDNVAVRAYIYAQLRNFCHWTVIDAGNDIYNGQVHVVFRDHDSGNMSPCWIVDEKPTIDKNADELGCDDLAQTQPQVLYINNLAAAFASLFVVNILDEKPILHNKVSFTSTGSCQYQAMTVPKRWTSNQFEVLDSYWMRGKK